MVLEDSETALIAPASMMLTSGVELLRSPTGCETCGSCWGQPAASWMVGRRTPFPSRTTVLTSHRRIWPSGPEMVMRRQAASCWQKLRTDRSLVFPMQRTPDEEAGHWWPTPSQESGPLATDWIGLDLFNDDTRPSGHISRPTQVNVSELLSFSKQLLKSNNIVQSGG